ERAALAALEAVAYEEAAELLEQAAATVAMLEPANRAVRTDLLLRAAAPRRASGDVAAATRAAEIALELAETVGDAELIGRATLAWADATLVVGAANRDQRDR